MEPLSHDLPIACIVQIPCDHCDRGFKNAAALASHVQSAHRLLCYYCSQTFINDELRCDAKGTEWVQGMPTLYELSSTLPVRV